MKEVADNVSGGIGEAGGKALRLSAKRLAQLAPPLKGRSRKGSIPTGTPILFPAEDTDSEKATKRQGLAAVLPMRPVIPLEDY